MGVRGFATRMSSLRFTAVEMELATTSVFPLQWLMTALITPVVSIFDDTSVWTVIVWESVLFLEVLL